MEEARVFSGISVFSRFLASRERFLSVYISARETELTLKALRSLVGM